MVGIKLRIKAEEPCSSAAARAADMEEEELRNGAGSLLNSPVSPVGRVAKRNASLLNGFDLKNGAAYSESMVGTVPDIQIHSVHECIPALKAVLETRLEEEDKKTLLVSCFPTFARPSPPRTTCNSNWNSTWPPTWTCRRMCRAK